MFKKLKKCADEYLAVVSCFDIAMLKTCVLAVGMLIGLAVSGRRKKVAAWSACLVFVATYIPLMYKFLPFLKEAFVSQEGDELDDDEDELDWDDIEEIEVECYE